MWVLSITSSISNANPAIISAPAAHNTVPAIPVMQPAQNPQQGYVSATQAISICTELHNAKYVTTLV